MRLVRLVCTSLAVGLAGMVAADEQAAPLRYAPGETSTEVVQPPLSLQAVMQHLESGTGSRVIGASQRIGRNGKPVYRIKLLTKEGVLRQIEVDPDTGLQR